MCTGSHNQQAFTEADILFYALDPKIITYEKLIIFTKQLLTN